MCGSFCTFKKAIDETKKLKDKGADIQYILSINAAHTDTRFGKASDFRKQLEEISGKEIIDSIYAAEPIGPKKLFDIILVCPCTGNTLAKLNAGIADTPVTLSVKAHLRNGRPVVLAPATNDALAANFKNIGQLMNNKNIYFVPFGQDDFAEKPCSLMSDFSLAEDTILSAMNGRQLQPVLLK